MTTLREALADYLRIRRRLGFEMPQDGRLLEGFVEFLERAGAGRVTTELALQWARLPVQAHPYRWRQRLSVVRGFARHLATIDPASEVPSKDLLPGHRPRIAPYIYTDEEIAALMSAADELTPALRAVRHRTLIGLLAVTVPGKRSRSTAQTSIFATACCRSVRASRRSGARSRCTTARSGLFASTPVSATLASPSHQRRRSSSPRVDDGWPEESSTRRSPC
jgi:hypothetical protein